ncbi:MAG: metal-dependent transcriptional regulator [Oscillospiraceae bacterium]|nr:metal-dependent transcriptional regulator [Oscillospiraceae bacterium]
MALLESGEMYLETIFVLSKNGKKPRSIDIVEHMGYSKPSVSRAVGLLKTGGYIEVCKDGFISMTELGREIAEKIYERHTIITSFLKKLGVEEKAASDDACKIEHVISDSSFDAIKKYILTDKQ